MGAGGGFQTVLSEIYSESVRFVMIERHVPRVRPACDFIQICRVKKLLLADLKDRWYGRGWSHQQRDIEDFPESERSERKPEKEQGPEHCLEEHQLGQEEGMRELH